MSDLDLAKYIEQLQGSWIYNLMRGTGNELAFVPQYAVSDGRSRERVVKTLHARGYLTLSADNILLVTAQAYNEISPTKPDLVGKLDPTWDAYYLERCRGVFWASLSSPEKKYIIEHAADVGYRFINYNPNWPAARMKYVAIGDCDQSDNLYVYDPEFDAERDRRLFEFAVKDAIGRNLSWGLEGQKLIDPVDADCFRQSGDSRNFLYADIMRFSADPEKWHEELVKQVHECRESIAVMTRRANVLLITQAKMDEAGGWKQFTEKYDARIREELIKEKEEARLKAVKAEATEAKKEEKCA